jgi:hypothetical protein
MTPAGSRRRYAYVEGLNSARAIHELSSTAAHEHLITDDCNDPKQELRRRRQILAAHGAPASQFCERPSQLWIRRRLAFRPPAPTYSLSSEAEGST